MKRTLGIAAALLMAWCAASCQKTHSGVFEAGNPGLRSVQGSVPREDGACLADQAVATDSDFQRTSVAIDDGCAFDFELPVGVSYSIAFFLNGVFVAATDFGGSDFFFLEEGEAPLNFGLIDFQDSTATAEFQPPPSEEGPQVSALFGTYLPGEVTGPACLVADEEFFANARFEVIDGGDSAVTVTLTALAGSGETLAQIVMTGGFVSPGYFSVSGLFPDASRRLSCEGPIGPSDGGWMLNATCAFALAQPPMPVLETCLFSNFLQTNP
jgi:hypothetical protein